MNTFIQKHALNLVLVMLLGAATCLALVPFAFLRHIPSFPIEATIELFTCFCFAADLWLNHTFYLKLVKSKSLRTVAYIAVLPAYTLLSLTTDTYDKTLAILAIHGLYLPVIFFRLRHHFTEHVVSVATKSVLTLGVLLFSLHFLASGWMLVQPRSDVDFMTEYNLALYFIMTTVATVGYGDITPSNNISRMYTMVLELIGVCVFGVVIGRMSGMIMNADRRKEMVKNQLESLTALFKHYEIPVDLQRKTYKFYQHILSRSSNEDEQKILSVLPHGLQAELRIFMNIKPIASVSLFKHCKTKCLIDAAKELEQIFLTPGQSIIKKGEMGDKMYIIGLGKVKVHDHDHVIAELGDGHCFGEMSLIEKEPRRADVTALTHCDIFVLSKDKFDQLVETHTDLADNVRHLMASRLKKAG